MFLPALNGYVMPVEVGRQEVRATAAIAATASAALKVAENTASASLKEAQACARFSDMKTASLKALGSHAAHLERRVLSSEKDAADLKTKLKATITSARSSEKELIGTRQALRDSQSSTTRMAARLQEFDGRDKSQSAELSRLNHEFQSNLITAERHRAACDSLLQHQVRS
jgi:septal ring factor EnvC (AmiA/AmiB activator)